MNNSKAIKKYTRLQNDRVPYVYYSLDLFFDDLTNAASFFFLFFSHYLFFLPQSVTRGATSTTSGPRATGSTSPRT